MDLSSSTTRTLSGLSILISGLIRWPPWNFCAVSSHHLETIRSAHSPNLRSKRPCTLGQMKVGIVRAHFQFSEYEAILRSGFPCDLMRSEEHTSELQSQ